MKIAKLFLPLIIAALVCTSCVSQQNSADTAYSSDFFSENETDSGDTIYSYSMRLSDGCESLTYSGENIKIKVNIENDETAVNLGFFVFVDGNITAILNNNDLCMKKISLAANESKAIAIEIAPSGYKKGNKAQVNTVCITEPDYMPSFTEGDSDYGSTHRAESLTSSLTFEKDTAKSGITYLTKTIKSEFITDDIRSTFDLAHDDYRTEIYEAALANSDPLKHYGLAPDRIEAFFGIENRGKSHVDIRNAEAGYSIVAFATQNYRYRVTIFVDNIPVKTDDGYGSFDFEMKTEHYVQECFDLQLNKQKRSTVYAIAIPLADNGQAFSRIISTDPIGVLA